MGRTLGIIGGGQLGMMLTEAAQGMPDEISRVIVLDPTEGSPASQAGAEQLVADFRDEGAIRKLAAASDVITYEIESGDSDVLESVRDMAEVNPPPGTLRTIQDKLLQKSFLKRNGIPVGDFVAVEPQDVEGQIKKYGVPALLKARRDAYDGRGNYRIDTEEQIGPAAVRFGDRPVFLERLVDFKMEVSVIAARNTRGEIKTYPVVENIHQDNILHTTVAPARVDGKVAEKAKQIARDTMGSLEGAGVFGIEMFVTREDDVLVNEIAPRVHNSGHHTLQSSATSQFEQHLRAILGMDLGDTTLLHPAVMRNILGPDGFSGPYRPVSMHEEGAYLKMYGKKESRPGRKLGHFNVMGGDGADVRGLIDRADGIMRGIRIEPV